MVDNNDAIARRRQDAASVLAALPRRAAPATTSAAPAKPDVPRWKDGTAKDELTRLEEELDIERFMSGDAEYQGRAGIKDKMSRYNLLSSERERAQAPERQRAQEVELLATLGIEVPPGADLQKFYNDNRARIEAAGKATLIEQQRDALDAHATALREQAAEPASSEK